MSPIVIEQTKHELKALLKIQTKELEQIFNQAFLDFTNYLQKNEPVKEVYLMRLLESFFDKAFLQKIKNGNWLSNHQLHKYLKKRLTKEFLVPNSPLLIRKAHQDCWKKFLQELLQEEIVLSKNDATLVSKFHKKWDKQLIAILQAPNKSYKEKAILHFYHYFSSFGDVQQKLKRLPESRNGNYPETTPFYLAFTDFIHKTGNSNWIFKENSDALFRKLFQHKLADFYRQLNSKKSKAKDTLENSFPDLTSVERYFKIETQLSELAEGYVDLIEQKIEALGNPCKGIIHLHLYENWKLEEIATHYEWARSTAYEKFNKCLKKIKDWVKFNQ